MNKDLFKKVIDSIPNMKTKPHVEGISTRLYRNDKTSKVSSYTVYAHPGANSGKQVSYNFNLTGYEFTVEQEQEILTKVNNLLASLKFRFHSQYDSNTRSDGQDDELDSFGDKLHESGDAKIVLQLRDTTVSSLEQAQEALSSIPMSLIDGDMNKTNLDELMNFKYRKQYTNVFGTPVVDKRISYAQLLTLEVTGSTDYDLANNICFNRTMKKYLRGQLDTIGVPLFIKNDFIAKIAYQDELKDFIKTIKDTNGGITGPVLQAIEELDYIKDTEVNEAQNNDGARMTLSKVLGNLRNTISVAKSESKKEFYEELVKLDEYIREHLGSILEDLAMIQDVSDSLKLNALTVEEYAEMYQIKDNPIIKEIFGKKVSRPVKTVSAGFAELLALQNK